MKWQAKAACTPEDSALMFSELGSKVARMKAICANCPVQVQCLALGMDDEFGIFGGMTPDERKQLATV